MTPVTFAWEVDAYLGGSWVDISADVMRMEDIASSYGITGTTPADRVAAPGTFSLKLDNSQWNSGAKLGYYSPDSANCRSGFGTETQLRLKIVSGGVTRYFSHSWIDTIEPTPGMFLDPVVQVRATDYFRWISNKNVKGLSVQLSQRPDQLISTAVGNLAIAPLATILNTDPSVCILACHELKDGQTSLMTLMQEICQSYLGYLTVIGDATGGETLLYETRRTRDDPTIDATFSDTMSGLTVVRDISKQLNNVTGNFYPAKYDTVNVVLAAMASEKKLAAGESQTVVLQFKDPNDRANKISALSLVNPPIIDVDYKMSSVSGDGGDDLNANLSVTPVVSANTVTYTVQNTGKVTGYVNVLQMRGIGIYLYDQQSYIAQSGSGDKVLAWEMPYIQDYYLARDFAMAVFNQVSAGLSDVSALMFYAEYSSTFMTYALTCDIGSRVSITESATGISRQFIINQITRTIQKGNSLKVEWGLVPADPLTYWTLEDATYGYLDTVGTVITY